MPLQLLPSHSRKKGEARHSTSTVGLFYQEKQNSFPEPIRLLTSFWPKLDHMATPHRENKYLLDACSHAKSLQFSSVQFSHSFVSDSVTLWIAAHQASLSITNSQSLLKLMSIKSVMISNHLILCRPLLLPPSIFPSIRVFSRESVLPKGL